MGWSTPLAGAAPLRDPGDQLGRGPLHAAGGHRPCIEHIGGVLAIGGVTGKDYTRIRACTAPWPVTASASASPVSSVVPVTTYAEVTGAVMITRNFNPVTMTWAAVFAIILAFFGKFNALLTSIPMPVMGGIMLLLFGSIAAIGLKTLVESKVDLGLSRNIAIVAVTLTVGVGALEMKIGDFALAGVGLASVAAILLNLILPQHSGNGCHGERQGLSAWLAVR